MKMKANRLFGFPAYILLKILQSLEVLSIERIQVLHKYCCKLQVMANVHTLNG